MFALNFDQILCTDLHPLSRSDEVSLEIKFWDPFDHTTVRIQLLSTVFLGTDIFLAVCVIIGFLLLDVGGKTMKSATSST